VYRASEGAPSWCGDGGEGGRRRKEAYEGGMSMPRLGSAGKVSKLWKRGW